VSALTRLTHEGPRSSVSFSQYVQPQSALGTSMGGLGRTCPVDVAIQAETDGLTFARREYQKITASDCLDSNTDTL